MIACVSRGNSPAAPNSIGSKVGRILSIRPARRLRLTLQGEITAANGALWNVFLGALAFGDETNKAIRDDLAVHAFDHLTGFSSDVLRPMAAGLADLIFFAPRQRIGNLDRWLDRLWEIISEQPEQPFDLSTDMYENAINSSAGKLAQTLLLEIDARRQVGADPSPRQLRCMREISSRGGNGRAARARRACT